MAKTKMLEQFEAARYASTPLIAVLSADPQATIDAICALPKLEVDELKKLSETPIVQWDRMRGVSALTTEGSKGIAAAGIQAAAAKQIFNPADYPSEDEARARFRMDWYSIQFSTPSSVKSISRQAWEEESNSMKEMVRDMTTDFQKTLCVEMQAVVDHMLECVQGNLNGKKRKFNSDLVDKAVEFFDNLPGRNITNVVELDKLAKQAKSILEGVESQDIRDRSSVRKEVAVGFAEIKATLETLVVDKPKRAVAIRKKEA